MDNRPGRAVALLAVSGLLLAGGWWWRSAAAVPPPPVPQPSPSPSWQASVRELTELWAARPNSSVVAIQPPVELSAGKPVVHPLKLPYGAFALHAVCVGDTGTMRVALTADDGRSLSAVDVKCSPEVRFHPEPLLLPQETGPLRLTMSLTGAATGIGAWRVLDRRAPGGADQWRLRAESGLPADRAARTLFDGLLSGGASSTADVSLAGLTELRVFCAGETMLRVEVTAKGSWYQTEPTCDSVHRAYVTTLGSTGTVRVTLTALGPAGSVWIRAQAVRLPPGTTPPV